MEKNAFKIAESMAKMQPLLQGDTERQGMKWGCREGEVGRTFPLKRKKKEKKKKRKGKKSPKPPPLLNPSFLSGKLFLFIKT